MLGRVKGWGPCSSRLLFRRPQPPPPREVAVPFTAVHLLPPAFQVLPPPSGPFYRPLSSARVMRVNIFVFERQEVCVGRGVCLDTRSPQTLLQSSPKDDKKPKKAADDNDDNDEEGGGGHGGPSTPPPSQSPRCGMVMNCEI